MLRFVLDTCAIDGIADAPGRFDVIRRAVEAGRLELLWTHVTIDELNDTPDADRRARLFTIGAAITRLVPTGAAVFDWSRWDFARWTEDEEAVEAFRRGNLRHTADAIIAATAVFEGCPLVTDETKTLPTRARARGIEVLDSADLEALAAELVGT